jgi:hypothetical protein
MESSMHGSGQSAVAGQVMAAQPRTESAELTSKSGTSHGLTARSASRPDDDEAAQDDVASFRGFLKGEWAALWPTWVLFLIMVAVIVWDRLV